MPTIIDPAAVYSRHVSSLFKDLGDRVGVPHVYRLVALGLYLFRDRNVRRCGTPYQPCRVGSSFLDSSASAASTWRWLGLYLLSASVGLTA